MDNQADRNVEIWRVKGLIKKLTSARGNGTSMISLVMPPKDQISRVSKMLADEYGTASNIKSKVNKLSVLSAITSVQQRLKLYNRVPKNGLVIYCGTILTEDSKEKKVNIDFEPFKPINTSLYLCDNKFHTEALQDLLSDDNKYGFIIMDGNGTLYATLTGNTRQVLQKFTVELPKKHGRGGQSAVRFARLREEKRHNYIRKVAENAVVNFIKDDKVNVKGLILAGSADFKSKLFGSDMFDPRLKAAVIQEVDISYGGEAGFNQAIELSTDCLKSIKFILEKNLLSKYFDEITRNDGLDKAKFSYGIKDTMVALENGAVDILIVWESLEYTRYMFRHPSTGENITKYLDKYQESERENFICNESGVDLEKVSSISLLEYLANNYKDYGATLEFVTDKSQEGAQFVKGFGGIGGILRYPMNFQHFDEENYDLDDEFNLSDYD